jgi:translation initiation factor IF-3
MAREQDLDLVEVAGQANPPVVKIMDFGKYKYEEAQRAKESRRKSTNISIKEMKYRPKIGQGDFDTKTRKVAEFLTEGHKVKITIMFRGREVFHPELGAKILDSIADSVAAVGKVETHARLDGRNMTMVLAPDKRAQAAAKRDTQREPVASDAPASPDGPAAPAARPVPTRTAPASAAPREPAPAVSAAPPDQG